jgi:flagellin
MTLRINHNIASQKALLHLADSDRKLVQSLERLASGFRINRGADDPAGLVISEQMRNQIAGVNQAISNTEIATAMVETTEGALGEISNLLVRMRELALHANNEGANDVRALEADQVEIENAIASIQRIASNTQFGKRKLLDGSSGITGVGQGAVSFIEATERTRTSPLPGYTVNIERAPTRAVLEGSAAVTPENVRGLTVTLFEGGRSAKVTGAPDDAPATFVGKLKRAVADEGLDVDVELTDSGTLRVEHHRWGSEGDFRAVSSVEGVLSSQAGQAEAAIPGQDVAGSIGGESGVGKGQFLRGVEGNENTEGLVLRVIGTPVRLVDEAGQVMVVRRFDTGAVGTVHVLNNSVAFQTGPNAGQRTSFSLPTMGPQFLGREILNESGFTSIADVNVTTPQGAKDSIALIDQAVDELTLTRGRLGAFSRNNLQTNLATLRVTAENLVSAESAIRDSDVAKELTEFTRSRIQQETTAALLAQANQIPRTVVSLVQ